MATLKQIDALIRGVASRYVKASDSVQNIGIMIMEHSQSIGPDGQIVGDVSRAKALVRAIPAPQRPKLVSWFAAYSPIRVTMAKMAKDDRVSLANALAGDKVDTKAGFGLFWGKARSNRKIAFIAATLRYWFRLT